MPGGKETEASTIPQLRQVFRMAKAELDALAGLRDGALGFATDETILYRQDGDGAANWEAITILSVVIRDTKTNLDGMTDLLDGAMAFGTDTGILYRQNGAGAANWEEVAGRIPKIKKDTRDMEAASGDVSYTGFGFRPTGLLITAIRASGSSVGSSEPSLEEQCHYVKCTPSCSSSSTTSAIIYIQHTGDGYQKAVVKTYDIDGFTLTWTKSNTPLAGVADLHILAFQ